MTFSKQQKQEIKQAIVDCLRLESEITKIVIFGSFLSSNNPNDIDVAIFQDSSERYLTLAMKYRAKTRSVANKIPLDIIPLKSQPGKNYILSEIDAGEIIYERRN